MITLIRRSHVPAVLLIVFILLPIICVAQTTRTESARSTPPISREMTDVKAPKERADITLTVLIPLASAILGGLAGAGISVYFSKRQAIQEYRALILSFCSEMLAVFERCVMYYRQSKTGEVSYSSLFSFTDASALSKFASVCKKPEVVAAIIELKSVYFQVQRHVEEASRFALEGTRTSDSEEKQVLMTKAAHAQGTALAFFLGSYERMESETALVVQTALQVASGEVAKDLSARFKKAQSEKVETDNL